MSQNIFALDVVFAGSDPLAIKEHKQEAYEKAVNNLARYKSMNFGYWAAIWVHLNRMDTKKERNPFKELVLMARRIQNEEGELLKCKKVKN